jgi:hypothetical protein
MMRRDLSPFTSASLESGNVVLREMDVRTGRAGSVCLRPEEWQALAAFLAQVEAGERPDEDESLCGAIRDEDDAYCVELEGHQDAGLEHVWVGGVRNLCIADPVPPDGPVLEPQEGSP